MGKAVETISEMVRALEDEIELVKSGKITEAVGRVVLRGRALQLQAASLNLQFQRMIKGRQPEKELKLIVSPPTLEKPKED